VISGPPEAEAEGPPAAVGSPRESASLWAALLRRMLPLRALLERLGLVSASPAAEPARAPPPRGT
jgi:hypothetical protein